MNTLISNRTAISSLHSYVLVKSEIVKLKKVKRIANDAIRDYLHRQNIFVIRTYLSGFVKSRIIAYKSKGVLDTNRAEQLSNFLYHLQTYKPKQHYKFYEFILNWETLITSCLPVNKDISHDKVHSVLASCNKYSMPF